MSTQQEPPGKAMWCETHQRPLGPDGRCILCVGNEEPTRTERRVVYIVLGLVLLGGAIPAAYVLLQDPPWRDEAVSSSPARRSAAARPAPRPAPRARLAPEPGSPPVTATPTATPIPAREAPARVRVTPLRHHAARRSPRHRQREVPVPIGIRPIPSPRVPVTVYVTSWCPHCRRAQRWLRRHKIRYQAIDVGRSAAGQRALRAVNPRGGVPTFVIGRRVIRGWSPLAVQYAIQAEKARLGGT